MIYDITIIGCGVIGALTARELTRYKLKVCILEAKSDVAMGASAANSGIVHAGFDAPEGSLKAEFNVRGSALMESTCAELGVHYKNNGSLVVAFTGEDVRTLEALRSRGQLNGVSGLKIIDTDELRKLEPDISENAVAALYAKTGGIVCPYGLTIAAAGNAMDNGADLITDFGVAAIESGKEDFTIISSAKEKVQAKYIINCAGINADEIAGMIGDLSFKIRARKGEYILFDRESGGILSRTLFTCPSEKGKGVLVSPTVDGNLFVGPTSAESNDKTDNSTSRGGLEFLTEKARQLCKNIPFNTAITSFCGIRAYADCHDFILGKSSVNGRFINAAGIESPGLSSAPAIAKHLSQLIAGEINDIEINHDFNGVRKPVSFFKDMGIDEKNALIKQNGAYGEIVCRCEEITLGEILFELNRNPVPKTVDGIKRRVRAGMGRCQGGFCQPSIVEILKNKFNYDYTQITKSGGASYMFTGPIK